MPASGRNVDERFLRLPAVIAAVGIGKSEIYRRIKAGTFPAAEKLSHKVAVWPASTIAQWQRLALPLDEDDLIG